MPVPERIRTWAPTVALASSLCPAGCGAADEPGPPATANAAKADAAPTKQAPSPAATPKWTREQEVCHHTAQFVESRKITVDEWHRLCLALMGPMKRSFAPAQWEAFSACVIADRAKDAMEECEARVRREANAEKSDAAPPPPAPPGN